MRRWCQWGLLCGMLSLSCGPLWARGEEKPARPPVAGKRLYFQLACGPAACASSDWGKMRTEWQEHMAEAAAAGGWVLVPTGSTPKASDAGTLVVVQVNDFRFVSPGARFSLGVFVGKASLDAKATFYQWPGRKIAGSQRYNTASNAWQGIFAAMTTKQVAVISEAIVRQASR